MDHFVHCNENKSFQACSLTIGMLIWALQVLGDHLAAVANKYPWCVLTVSWPHWVCPRSRCVCLPVNPHLYKMMESYLWSRILMKSKWSNVCRVPGTNHILCLSSSHLLRCPHVRHLFFVSISVGVFTIQSLLHADANLSGTKDRSILQQWPILGVTQFLWHWLSGVRLVGILQGRVFSL